MTTEPIETRERADATTSVDHERLWVGAGLVILGLLAWIVFSAEAPVGGSQRSGPQVTIDAAAPSGWEPLATGDGGRGESYPEPMVWRGSELCIGFGRVDFDADDRRPSLARCVDAAIARSLDNGQIMSLMVIESGPDMWHFLEADSAVAEIVIELADGARVSPDRIGVAGSTIALRLEQGVDLERLEWKTDSGTFHCPSDPRGWQTSAFCVAD